MREQYGQQLKQLKEMMLQMGSLIEKAIAGAATALMNQDANQAKQLISEDEEIDNLESDIEKLCLKLILRQQPIASDLRFISAALKMITDMERIGDHASDISEMTILMADKPYIENIEHMKQMAVKTTFMVSSSMEAFVEQDEKKARDVIAYDDIVDELFMTVKEELIDMINKDRECGEQAADLLMVAKYFERIGDHATNIAEWVIYSITGVHKSQQ